MNSILKHVFENLKHHWTLSLSAVIVIGLLFFLLNLLVFSSALSAHLLAALRNRISFNVYLKEDTDFFTVRQLMETLEKRRDVVPPVMYISPEEAKQQLMESLGLNERLLKKYELDFPASLRIIPQTPSDEQTIRTFLQASPFQTALDESTKTQGMREGKTFEAVSKNLERLKRLIHSFVGLLIGFLIFTGTLTIFITLRFVASLRKKELFIMKLIGASPRMLEIPYVLEGIFMAVLGLALGTFLFLITPALFFQDPFLLETYKNLSLGKLFFLEFFGSVLVGSLGSILMVRKLLFSKKTLHFTL